MSRVCLVRPEHVAPDSFTGSSCGICASQGHLYPLVDPADVATCENGCRSRRGVPGRTPGVCPYCGGAAQ